MRKSYKNIIGERFSFLTVLKEVPKKSNARRYLCLCDCGKKKEVDINHMVSRNTISCGCKGKESVKEANKIQAGQGAFNCVYNEYKFGAIRREINFNLTKEEFREIVTKNCSYCGSEPRNIHIPKSLNGEFVYSGIDRIDSSLGYFKENCAPCCKICNYMKRSYSTEEFKNHVTLIYKFLNKQ